MNNTKQFFLIFCLVIPLLVAPRSQAGAGGGIQAATNDAPTARAVIEHLNDTLISCMKQGEELGFQGRYNLLLPVMKEAFWYSLMVRKATGSYWRKMTPEERKTLLDKYIAWSVSSYAERFTRYKGQQFVISSCTPFREKYRRVVVDILKNGKKKRSLEYLLAFDHDRNSWRIVDIRVKGISQLSLTRAQFKAVLKLTGVDGLLALLDEKIEALTPRSDTK